MLTNASQEEIKLFISEANRLLSKSFYKDFHGVEVGFGIEEVENAPSEEQTEAYVLHFRKFLQKNDRVCIHAINSLILENISSKSQSLNDWNQLYSILVDMLNAPSVIGRVNMPGAEYKDSITLLQIFKAKTYSDLSHLDKAKRKRHHSLSSTKTLDGLYRFEYFSVLMECGELIEEMKEVCKKLLREECNPKSAN